MYLHAQRAFGINPDQHYRLLHTTTDDKTKVVVLSVIVIEAEGLEAKDANGTYVFSNAIIQCCSTFHSSICHQLI